MTQFVAQSLKAVYGALVAGLGALQVALLGGPLESLTAAQWVGIVTTAVLAFGGVYGIANKAPGDQGEQATAAATETEATPPPVADS